MKALSENGRGDREEKENSQVFIFETEQMTK